MLSSKCARRPNVSMVLRYRMWEKAEPGMCRTGLGSFLPQPWVERLVSVNPTGRGLISV